MLATLVAHNMIREKMAAKREAAAKGAAKRAGSDSGDEAPAAVPLEGSAAASPERRVTAKASMRARRRMA